MTNEEAAGLVDQVKRGRLVRVHWEGADAYSSHAIRFDAEQGIVSRYEETPYDAHHPVLDPVTRSWEEDELVKFLTTFRNLEVETE